MEHHQCINVHQICLCQTTIDLRAINRIQTSATVGMFFFQMTMPVTLTAVYGLIPSKPAFSFGLCALFYILGVFASSYEPWEVYYNSYTFFGLIAFSAGLVFVALNRLKEVIPMKFTKASD